MFGCVFLSRIQIQTLKISLNATVKQCSFSSQQWLEHKTILDGILHDCYSCSCCIQGILTTARGALYDTVMKAKSETLQFSEIPKRQLRYFHVPQLPISPRKEPQSLEKKFSGSQITRKVTCRIRIENVPSAYRTLLSLKGKHHKNHHLRNSTCLFNYSY